MSKPPFENIYYGSLWYKVYLHYVYIYIYGSKINVFGIFGAKTNGAGKRLWLRILDHTSVSMSLLRSTRAARWRPFSCLGWLSGPAVQRRSCIILCLIGHWSLVYWYLVGGDWNMTFMTFHILGMSTSQLTFILFRGFETTNQILLMLLGILISSCINISRNVGSQFYLHLTLIQYW